MTRLMELVGPAIKKVLSISDTSHRFIGTAFAISDRTVLTCRHVVQNGVETTVLDGEHRGHIALDWTSHEDPTLDVALGTATEPLFPKWLTPACVDVAAIRSALTCVGYGSEDRGVESWQDHVAGEVHAYGLVTLQNPVHRGCSGGPVLDARERPVAITVARHQDRATKYVLPVRSFYRWMEDLGYRPMQSEPEPGTDRTWLLMVPVGPIVPLDKVPPEVIEAFATALCTVQPARRHLAAVNDLVLRHNPECLDERQITLPMADQPTFDIPHDFWSTVFSLLGRRSRRSVAALLEATGAPSSRVQAETVRDAFERFRDYLLSTR